MIVCEDQRPLEVAFELLLEFVINKITLNL